MFEYFHWISFLVLLNYVQMMEVHICISMYVAKLKHFLSLKIISSFSEFVSWFFLLFPFSLCKASEEKFLFIPGTRLGFLGPRKNVMIQWTVFRDNTKIPGLEDNFLGTFFISRRRQSKNSCLGTLGFWLRLENGSTSDDLLYQPVHK